MKANIHQTLVTISLTALLSSCMGISQAPEGSPRVEAEVEVRLGPSIYEALQDGEGGKALESVLTRTVLAKADLGLRLYPVPVGEYQTGHTRPDYVLLIQVEDFAPQVATKVVKRGAETIGEEKNVDRLDCSATATLWKRRSNGPMLVVGKSQGKGLVYVYKKSKAIPASASFELREDHGAGAPLRVRNRDVAETVEKAVVDALRQLEEAVDRELTLIEG